MSKQFEIIKEELEKLPRERQEELTEKWLDEIKWAVKFETSPNELELLANEALAEYKTGKTKEQ
ncbi:MAG: hypothetical protein AB8B73_10595 [Ekhidna sp.]